MRTLTRPLLALAAALSALVCAAAAPLGALDPEAWVEVRSPHFTVGSGAGAERGVEIARSLERFRTVFARLAPALELRSPAPTTLLAFADAAAYAPYKTVADRGDARVLGQFLSHPDGNYLTLDAGTRLVSSFAVIYHEYVHYLVRHNFPDVPRWFNEGLAEYYSTFAVEGDRVLVGRPVERHVLWLRRHGDFSLAGALAADSATVAAHDAGEVGQFYAVSWALVHYLLSGGVERLDATADYFSLLEQGEDPEEAFEEAFDLRLGEVEAALRDYVVAGDFPAAAIPLARVDGAEAAATARPMAPADVFYQLGDLLIYAGQLRRAEQHLHAALDERPGHPEAHAALAMARDLEQRFDEAEVLYADAVDLGSRDPRTFLRYGRHLLTLATQGEPAARLSGVAKARRMLRRTVELDPDFGEGWALLAAACLEGEADPAAGVAAARRARDLLPNRMDVVFNLAQLYVLDGKPELAHALVEAVLAVRADADFAARARQEIERLELIEAAQAALEQGEAEEGIELFDRAISLTPDLERRSEMEERLTALRRQLEAD